MDRELFTLTSRIHVILRYQEKREVDVTRLQSNADYAQEILGVCAQSTNPELVHLGVKLNDKLFGEGGVFDSPSESSASTTASDIEQKYLRSLR